MLRRPKKNELRTHEWSRHKMLALFAGACMVALALLGGVGLTVVYAVHPHPHPTALVEGQVDRMKKGRGSANAEDALADKPMTRVDTDVSHPGPVSTADPGAPLTLPAATSNGPAEVPSGFPRTPQGALAQLASIDQAALQSGSIHEARRVISQWALSGGPTPSNWSGVRALAQFFDAAGLSGGGSNQLALVVTPLMGQIKGSVGGSFVVPCVDFEVDVTLQQTSRGASADCQRMRWNDDRWMVALGKEPADAPSVWPDTDLSFAVGYRDLRWEPVR